jgi:hypothetical protein
MKHCSLTGRRNHGRNLKRLLDTWDRNVSTSDPAPRQIYDDDDARKLVEEYGWSSVQGTSAARPTECLSEVCVLAGDVVSLSDWCQTLRVSEPSHLQWSNSALEDKITTLVTKRRVTLTQRRIFISQKNHYERLKSRVFTYHKQNQNFARFHTHIKQHQYIPSTVYIP